MGASCKTERCFKNQIHSPRSTSFPPPQALANLCTYRVVVHDARVPQAYIYIEIHLEWIDLENSQKKRMNNLGECNGAGASF